MSIYRSALSSITLFVLLDLLGAAEPRVPSYFLTTHWAYQSMASVERRLRDMRKLKSSPNHPSKRKEHKKQQEPMFLYEGNKSDGVGFMGGMIEDDHIPFMKRGVEVLHIIPIPFPAVWHTLDDDAEHLDIDTTEDWAQIVTGFTAEWMDLEGYMPKGAKLATRGVDEALQERDTSDHDEL
jgi:glutaminyl-peptide cyclotransferase